MKPIIKIKIALAFICIMFGINSNAQNSNQPAGSYTYKNAIGIRGGVTSGLTFKHFMNQSTTIEGIVSAWPYNFQLTGLYEKYSNTSVPGLNFYYGAGGHIRTGDYNTTVYHFKREVIMYRNGETGIGVDGILGLEYKIKPIPFAISLDVKPFLEVTNTGNSYFSFDPSLGIKFTF
ncbi:MAG: hypothetical protein HYZ42_15280 [Bacteroidetes bacterium]|nr:hypothetical protein [Bacteroidota bacterium]